MNPVTRPHRKSALRQVARRLPVLSAYERKIAALNSKIAELERLTGRLWVEPGHFYSPIPDAEDAVRRLPAHPTRDLPGVDLAVSRQWANYDRLRPILREVDFAASPTEARERGRRYHYVNPNFGDFDAAILEAVLRDLQPRRIVEVGCGYSSACLLDVRDRGLVGDLAITLVEPHPALVESLLSADDLASVEVLPIGTQQIPLELLAELGDGDVLLVDSTHVVRTGSDVVHLFHELLPAVRPGVWVQLHDHFAGFEYPAEWVGEGRSWNEQYLTRAFLQFNSEFEIALWPQFLQTLDPERYFDGVPRRVSGGGALWIRRVS